MKKFYFLALAACVALSAGAFEAQKGEVFAKRTKGEIRTAVNLSAINTLKTPAKAPAKVPAGLTVADFCGVWEITYMGMFDSNYGEDESMVINISQSEEAEDQVLVSGFAYYGAPVKGTVDLTAGSLTIAAQTTYDAMEEDEDEDGQIIEEHWVATFGGVNDDNTIGDLVFVMEEGKESMYVVDDVPFGERVEIDDEYAGFFNLGMVLNCEKSLWEYAGQGVVEPGFICAMYGIPTVPSNTVDVYTTDYAPGLYRMVGAYSGLFSGNDFYLNMEYPALPKVPYQNTGLMDGQDGITYVMSLTANEPKDVTYTTPEEFLAAGEAAGHDYSEVVPTYDEETRTVIFPGNAILFNWPEGENPNSLYSSQKVVASKIVLPAVSGVKAVTVENAEAPVEYFNLQGIRVANPENGLYIRRQGDKTTKVLVK